MFIYILLGISILFIIILCWLKRSKETYDTKEKLERQKKLRKRLHNNFFFDITKNG